MIVDMTQHRSTRQAVTLADVRDLATLPVWHSTRPSAAAVLGIGRSLAYVLADRGELPTIRLGQRVVVPVPRLLAMLGEAAPLMDDQGERAGQAASSHGPAPGPLTERTA